MLQRVKSAASASGARVANTGRGLFRPARASRRTGRVTRWHEGAVNLWTVGCADPRLTAQARSPMDKPGKAPRVYPTLPTGRRLPTSFTAPQHHSTTAPTRYEFDSGKSETTSRLPALAYSPRKLSKRPGPSQSNRLRGWRAIRESSRGSRIRQRWPRYLFLRFAAEDST